VGFAHTRQGRGFRGRCPHPAGAFCKTPLHPKTFIFFIRLASTERIFFNARCINASYKEYAALLKGEILTNQNESTLLYQNRI